MQTYQHVVGTLDVDVPQTMVETVEVQLAKAYVSKTVASMMGHLLQETEPGQLRTKVQMEVKLLRGQGLKEKEVLHEKLMAKVSQALSFRP